MRNFGHCLEPIRFSRDALGSDFGHHMGWRDTVECGIKKGSIAR
jgi:hypothetical protein